MTDTDQKLEDAVLKRMLETPPAPHKSPQHFIVLDGKMLVADITQRGNGSMVADLYRNIADFRSGRSMERAVNLTAGQLSPAK